MGHARALLSLDSPSMQIKLYREIQKNNYSVRKVEALVNRIKNGEDIESSKKNVDAANSHSAAMTTLKNQLSTFFNAKVQLTCNARGKGKICLPYSRSVGVPLHNLRQN